MPRRNQMFPLFGVLLCVFAGSAANAQSIRQARDDLRTGLSDTEFASGLVGLMTLADEFELAGATYDIDDTGNTELSVIGIPFQKTLSLWGEDKPGLYLEGAIGTANARQEVDDLYQGAVPSARTEVLTKTRTYAGLGGVGAEFKIADGLTITPLASFGLAYLENDTRYRGPGRGFGPGCSTASRSTGMPGRTRTARACGPTMCAI